MHECTHSMHHYSAANPPLIVDFSVCYFLSTVHLPSSLTADVFPSSGMLYIEVKQGNNCMLSEIITVVKHISEQFL